MKSRITKYDVFRYMANQLTRSRRQELEAACNTDAQVRRWFEELTPRKEELVDNSASGVSQLRDVQRLPRPGRHARLTTTPRLPAWTPGILAADRRGRLPRNMPTAIEWTALSPAHLHTSHESVGKDATKTKAKPASKEEPLPTPPFTCVRDETLISAQNEQDVPFGLVRVFVLEEGKPTRTKIIVLEHSAPEKLWRLELPLHDFFEGDVPDGEPEYYLVPADEGSADWFPVAEVRNKRDRLPKTRSVERERLSEFIELLES